MNIHVTKANTPSLKSIEESIHDIFSRQQFSNTGPYVKKLKSSLSQYLNIDSITLCANGTLALQIAIRFLGLAGKKVITTPFSYVATTSALLWEGCEPVFVDINSDTLCIEPEDVEKAITPHVAGILPVHVFGNACNVEGFEKLSQKYNIPILYDAAHAFDCTYANKSLFAYGNCSVASFHATKLFHTCEGGAIFTTDKKSQEATQLYTQFGHIGDKHYSLGINAKLSELHAVVGLGVLPMVQQEIALRKERCLWYDTLLNALPLKKPLLRAGLQHNYGYYPIIFSSEATLDAVKKALEQNSIFPRRYFYPSLNTLPYLKDEHRQHCPNSEKISNTILCLPLYRDLAYDDIVTLTTTIKNSIHSVT